MKDTQPPNNWGVQPPGVEYPLVVPMEPEDSSVTPLQIQRFFIFLRRYWWTPVLALLVAFAVGLACLACLAPTYISTARIWETEKLTLPGGAEFRGDSMNYYGTQIELLRSVKMQQLALNRLQNSRTNTVPLGDDNKPISVKLQVTQAPKSTVFAIEASCSNPEFAQAFLNALTVEYVEYKRSIRKLVSGDTLSSISDQVLRLEKDLKADQDALTAFQRTNNLVILQQEGSIAGAYLARLETQLSDLKLESQLLEASAVEQDWSDLSKSNVVILADSFFGPSSIPALGSLDRQSAMREVELLKIQRDKLSRYLRPKHPKVAKLDADIDRAQKLIDLFRNQNHEQLSASRQALKMRIGGVESAIREWEPKVLDANGRIAEAERLKLNITRSQGLYDRLVTLLQNVDIGRNIDQETVAILDAASPALRSYKLAEIVMGLAAFLGLVAGLGVVLLIDLRDDRFISTREASEKFAGAIVGQVPEMQSAMTDGTLPLLEYEDKRHMFAESYRNLRSALVYLPGNGERTRVILVTSALPGEGKSTIAANLARSLAFGGSRVLLVDGDLRKGQLHQQLGLASEPGLAELLGNPDALKQVVQYDAFPNLAFIARGRGASHPADIFLGAELNQVINLWRQKYDYVLIDSSPVFAADDATTLAPKVDGTLFVVRSRYSRAGAVREALDLLNQRHAKVLGMVYNRADASSRSYYYYKHEHYARPALASA